MESRPLNSLQRIYALDGLALNTRLFGWLRHPDLAKVTIVTYRYHDFHYQKGTLLPESPDSLINTLCRAAEYHNVQIKFVTRDPFTDQSVDDAEARRWYRGLERLQRTGNVQVLLHSALHAKVYLAEMNDDRRFYAVGSSNLTKQGMGYGWAECNIAGNWDTEFNEVKKKTDRIILDGRKIQTFDEWTRNAKKRGLKAVPFLMA